MCGEQPALPTSPPRLVAPSTLTATHTLTPHLFRPALLGLDNSEILQQLREGVESSRTSIKEAEGCLRETEVKMVQLSTEYRELQRQQTELGKRKVGETGWRVEAERGNAGEGSRGRG